MLRMLLIRNTQKYPKTGTLNGSSFFMHSSFNEKLYLCELKSKQLEYVADTRIRFRDLSRIL